MNPAAPFLNNTHSQLTDGMTQASLAVLGLSPAVANSNAMQLISQATGLAAQNAVAGQQQTLIINQASLARILVSMLPSRPPQEKPAHNPLWELEAALLIAKFFINKEKS